MDKELYFQPDHLRDEKERQIYRNAEKRLWEAYEQLVAQEGLEEISREDLLNLTGLPDDYELRPWPQFPSAEEVERILGRAAYARHTSEITANWRIIEERLKEQKVPPLIREIILKSCGQPFHFPVKIRIGDKTREGQDVGYRFDSQKYEGLQKEYKEKYDKIKEILEK